MTPRSIPRALLVLLFGALAIPSPTRAQSAARRPVRAGAVTGVEMQIEGALSGRRGGDVSFAVTAYDVVGLSELRVSSHATVRALSSLAPAEPVAEVEADASGRALIRVPIPEDAPASFGLVLELRSRARALRRFELPVRVTPARAMDLHVAPERARPGDRVAVRGRLMRLADHTGVPGVRVEITGRDASGVIGPAHRVTTDAHGSFEWIFRLPRESRSSVSFFAATVGERPLRTQASLAVDEPQPVSMIVVGRAARRVVAPGTQVDIEVVARRPDGRPVAGAEVTLSPSRPHAPVVRTDARGHATLRWRAPDGAGARTQLLRVTANKAGVGAGGVGVPVFVTDRQLGARASIEGGALSPELGGRLLVRTRRWDLASTAELPVTLRFAGREVTATTDTDGAAELVLPGPLVPSDGSDGCGGGSAMKATLVVGGPETYEHDLCVPLDPDAVAQLRLDRYRVAPGQDLTLHVRRTRAARRLPVVVTAFRQAPELRPFATAVLPPNRDTVTLSTPADYVGPVMIRARGLVGSSHVEVRGGNLRAEVAPQDPTVTVSAQQTPDGSLHVQLGATDEVQARYSVLPLTRARLLRNLLRDQSPDAHTELFARAELANETIVDRTAPAVLRGGRAVDMPGVDSPEHEAMLRDPWRARARFTEGRLSLIFRALETLVAQSVPGNIEHVAVRRGDRLRLNDRVLEPLDGDAELGAAGATGLGGEPLRLSTLRRLDRDFGYDAVARRVTRRRLFRVLIALRQFVRERDFDLPWARLGEPERWLRNMAEQGIELPDGDSLDAREFVDAWGHPFALRRSNRGGPLAPVPGYAVVSAGPDGRFGTSDDLSDPLQRVLRAGGLYAKAVGEDLLLARLSGVEIARATLRSVAGLFSLDTPEVPQDGEPAEANTDAGTLPTGVSYDEYALDLVRPVDSLGVLAARTRAVDGHGVAFDVPAPSVPQPVGVVVETIAASGARHVYLAEARAGGDLLADPVLPSRLRVGEELTARVHLTNLVARPLEVAVATGAHGLTASAPESVMLPAGESRDVPITLSAADGADAADLSLSISTGARRLRATSTFEVEAGTLPLALVGTALSAEDAVELSLTPPADARALRGRLVVITPRALWRDPALHALSYRAPGLYAFSTVLGAQPLPPSLRARLLRLEDGGRLVPTQSLGRSALSPAPLLDTAGAVVALSTLLDDPDARSAAQRMAAQVGAQLASSPQAATLAALATRGLSHRSAEARDPLARALAAALPRLRRTLRDRPGDDPALARAAAALLLADPEDLHGLSMLARVEERLETAPGGKLVASSAEDAASGDGAERAAASLALSIAAWQAGRPELAAALASAAMRHEQALLGGTDEQLFWLLASAGFGAMNAPDEPVVRADIDGDSHEGSLSEGVYELPVTLTAGEETEVRVEATPGLIVRLEASYDRLPSARTGPLQVTLRGEAAEFGRPGLFEIGLETTSAVARPIVELTLPAGADYGEQLEQAFRGNSALLGAEQRAGGILRLRFAPLAAGQHVNVPLPLTFTATGRQTGLATLAFPEDDPAATTVLPARVIDVTGGQE